MRRILFAGLLLFMAWPLAAADLSKLPPIEVKVRLGSQGGDLSFSPKRLNFQTGKLYNYALGMAIGVVVVILVWWLAIPRIV